MTYLNRLIIILFDFQSLPKYCPQRPLIKVLSSSLISSENCDILAENLIRSKTRYKLMSRKWGVNDLLSNVSIYTINGLSNLSM